MDTGASALAGASGLKGAGAKPSAYQVTDCGQELFTLRPAPAVRRFGCAGSIGDARSNLEVRSFDHGPGIMATDRDFQYDLRHDLQPLLRPVCAFAAGIVASDAAGVPLEHALAGCAAAAILALLARKHGFVRAAFAAALVAVALAGAWRASFTRSTLAERPIRRLVDDGRILAGDALQLAGVLEAPVDPSSGGARLRIAVSELRLASGEHRASPGRVSASVTLSDEVASSALRALGLERGTPIIVEAVASDDLAFRNPGVETLRAGIRRAGFDLAVRVDGPGDVTVTGPTNGCPVLRRLSLLRPWGLAEIDAAFTARTAGVLRALLLGDDSRLDEETAESYRQSGAYHVLVISGAHIALLAGLTVWTAGRFTRSPFLRLAAAAGPAWLYALVLGCPAPVVRAALAVTVAFTAPLAGRRAPPPNTLALAAAVVLVFDPTAVWDPSFQLTFSAVAAIVCIAAPVAERLADVGRWRPHRAAPYPPVCSNAFRAIADVLFWDERRFRRGRPTESVRFGVVKHWAAVWLSLWRLQGAVRRIVVGLWIAVSVQMAIAPLAVFEFGRMTLAGTFWALAVEAALGFALIAGLAFLCLRAAAPAAAPPVEWVADELVVLSNRLAAAAPPAWPMARPGDWWAVGFWAAPFAVVTLAVLIDRWHPLPITRRELGRPTLWLRLRIALTAAVLLVIGSTGVPVADRAGDGLLHVLFLDVGQGDAALVRFPDGTTMLIDAGGRPRFDEPLGFVEGAAIRAERFDIGDRVVAASLLAQGCSRLDWLVATHGDVDHVGGCEAVTRRLVVGRVVIGAGADEPEQRVAARAGRRGIDVAEISAGDAFEIAGARLEVLWPPADGPSGNDGSLVLRIVFGERAILFTGDLEHAGETGLLRLASANGWSLRADVLKVPHHGSRGASSSGFIEAVAPRWAVVSAPRRSPYGHPHAEAVSRLREGGAMVLQTGVDGAVGFMTDGREIELLRIAEPGTQLLPPELDHGARSDRTNSPGGPQ